MKKARSILIIISAVLFGACDGGPQAMSTVSLSTLDSIPASAWAELSSRKIFFGHQSVGNNIIEGMKDAINANPAIKLNIVDTSDPDMFRQPLFAHAKVGKNQDPLSKNAAFAGFISSGIGGRADFAFFKYCYIDVNGDSDVTSMFREYTGTMDSLKKAYPGTRFIHVTVPLTVVQTGARAWVKKLIGRPIGGYADNIKRNAFNGLLKTAYAAKEPVFDLAGIEATRPDGGAETFKSGGAAYHAAVPEYTSDGRHLNAQGRRIVAEQLLVFLAKLAQDRSRSSTSGIR